MSFLPLSNNVACKLLTSVFTNLGPSLCSTVIPRCYKFKTWKYFHFFKTWYTMHMWLDFKRIITSWNFVPDSRPSPNYAASQHPTEALCWIHHQHTTVSHGASSLGLLLMKPKVVDWNGLTNLLVQSWLVLRMWSFGFFSIY
jgi:hypothetical protein